jgi:peptidoglycan/LPS O-acetylase OafA/YrhL
MKIIFLLSLLTLSSIKSKSFIDNLPENLKTCWDKIKDKLNLSELGLSNNLIFDSGSNINELGLYTKCNRDESSNYQLLRANITLQGQSSWVSLGLCLPLECQTTQFSDFVVHQLSSLTNLPQSQFQLINSKEKNEQLTRMNSSNIIFLIFFSLYFIIASGIIQIIMKKYMRSKMKKYSSASGKKLVTRIEESSDNDSETDISNSTKKGERRDSTEEVLQKQLKEQLLNETHLEKNILKNNTFYQFLEAINFSNNLAKLMYIRPHHLNSPNSELRFMDSIRVILALYIVVLHSLVFILDTPVRGVESFVNTVVKTLLFQFICNASFAVDLFFSFSGFFLSYISLRKFQANMNGIKFFFNAILYRLIRIWPLVTLAFLFHWKLISLLGDGPIYYSVMGKELASCEKQWPWILLMVQNWTYGLYETEAPVCFGWYWYIPNDFQLSIIGIALIILYKKNFKLFLIVFTIIICAGLGLEVRSLLRTRFGINIFKQGTTMSNFVDYYILIYNRCSPFWIGLIFGILYYEYKNQKEELLKLSFRKSEKVRKSFEEDSKIDVLACTKHGTNNTSSLLKKVPKVISIFSKLENNRLYAVLLIISGAILMCFIIILPFFTFDKEVPYAAEFAYNFLSRKLFAVAFQLFCFGFIFNGFQTFRDNVMSGWIFQPLSKLSFALYIVHPFIIKFCYYCLKYSIYLKLGLIFTYAFGFIIISLVWALFIHILFEMPFMNIKTETVNKKSLGESKMANSSTSKTDL